MAVYTEIDDDALIEFMSAYDVGEVLSCKGIADGIENSNFAVTTSAGPFILTLYEKRVKPEDLPYFLSLKEHLAKKGIPCPVPIATKDGDTLRTLSDRPAALISFLPGMWPKRTTPDQCWAVGETLARLHLAGIDFEQRRDNDLGPLSWRPLLQSTMGSAEDRFPGLCARLMDELAEILTAWPNGLPAGVIHADLFPDNVFFRREHLSGVIDFYFACNDAFAYDIAVCLNAWCFERDNSFNVTKSRRLLAGYQSVRALQADELQALPILSQGAAMRFLLTRLYDWLHTPDDAFVTPKDPDEYIKKLAFHRSVKGLGSYGLDT